MTSIVVLAAAAALATLAPAGSAHAADISGTYRCQPDPTPCLWSGPSPAISETGNKLQIKNDKGDVANATLTSDITISAGGPFNSYGIIRPDKSIDWSNGTKWQKQ